MHALEYEKLIAWVTIAQSINFKERMAPRGISKKITKAACCFDCKKVAFFFKNLFQECEQIQQTQHFLKKIMVKLRQYTLFVSFFDDFSFN